MSQAIADQLFLSYMGRAADTQWRSNTTTLITAQGGNPTKALKDAFYTAGVAEGVYAATDSPSTLVNKFFLNTFGFAARTDEQTFWGNLLANGTYSAGELVWQMFSSYANNTTVLPTTYVVPMQSKLVALAAYSNALTDPTINAAYSQINSTAATAGRTYLTAVTSQATAATAITGVAATVAAVSVASGSTFTLTTTLETFTGTGGNDTFLGDANTTSAGDTLTGGAGSDTLKLFGNTAKPTFSGIETVFLSGNTAGFDVSTNADVTVLELDDPTTAQTYTVTTGQAVKVSTMVAGEAITLAGSTPTSLAVTLNSVAASGADVTLNLTGTKVATLNLTTATAASQITLTNAGGALTTVNVTGDKNLELGHALTTITTINASTATGAVNVDTVGASALAFTGGSGADRIDLVATLTSTDSIVGGAGSDTVAIGDADTLTTITGAKVSGFEIFEANAGDATAYDVDTLIGTNALTGVLISSTAAATTVNNINSAAINNISLTADTPTSIAVTGKSFTTGGISDTATVILNNSVDDNADGVDIATTFTFTQVDRLTVQATSDDTTAARAIQNSIAGLTATDLDLLTITGNAAVSITAAATTAAVQEIDASASTGAVTAVTTAAAIATLIYRGNDKVDTVTFNNAATNGVTLFTGGGSDVLQLGVTGAAHTLNFTATDFTTGDVKAGNVITINNGAAFQAGDTVSFNFGSAIEALLKVGGVTAAATAANFTLVGGTLGATTNMVAVQAVNDTTLQFDLNGDGVFTSTLDFSIVLTGLGANTLNYIAATDLFTFTAVAA